MIRRTLVGCAACALAVVCVLTPAVPQAQGQGQDGPIADLQRRVHMPEQQVAGLSDGGRFVDLGLVVVDTQTNLVWEKKTTEVGSGENFDDLHDVDNTYTWCQATGNNEGPRCLGNATSWIDQVNAEAFAGFTNWRVPTREELLFIVDTSVATCRKGTPCIDAIFGPTQASDYSSSTEVSPNVAWIVIFSSGNLKFGTKSDGVHVRAVRSGPSRSVRSGWRELVGNRPGGSNDPKRFQVRTAAAPTQDGRRGTLPAIQAAEVLESSPSSSSPVLSPKLCVGTPRLFNTVTCRLLSRVSLGYLM